MTESPVSQPAAASAPSVAPPRRGRTLRALAMVLLGLAGSAALAELVLQLLPVHSALRTDRLEAAQPVTRLRPNQTSIYSRTWSLRYVNRRRVNNEGFFNDQDYQADPARPLAVVIGDSYIQAEMLPYRDTFYGRLSDRLAARGTVYSFAMNGTGFAQYVAYARHAAETYRPQMLVVLVVASDFLDPQSFGYSYAHRKDGEFELQRLDYRPSRLKELMSHSAFCRYLLHNLSVTAMFQKKHAAATLRAEAAGGQISLGQGMIAQFLADIVRVSGLPANRILLLVDGMRPELYEPEALPSHAQSLLAKMRRTLFEGAARAGIETIDMQPIFIEDYQRNHLRFEWPGEGHWNQRAHRLAADAVRASKTAHAVFGESGLDRGHKE